MGRGADGGRGGDARRREYRKYFYMCEIAYG